MCTIKYLYNYVYENDNDTNYLFRQNRTEIIRNISESINNICMKCQFVRVHVLVLKISLLLHIAAYNQLK